VAAELAAFFAITGRGRFQIRASAERTIGAGEYGDGGIRISVEGEERIKQFSCGGAVDRIAPLRPVDRDDVTGPSRSTRMLSVSAMAGPSPWL
jgi:hypothetical protein